MLFKPYDLAVNYFLNHYSKKLHKKYSYAFSPTTKERYKDAPMFVNGWQAICLESEIKTGKILSKKIMSEDVIVWKNDSNEVSVLNAYCPHFGVHLASGGEIIGSHIRCPFHHRHFDISGDCPGKKPLFSYPLKIIEGIIFVWFHSEKKKPTWDIPDLSLDSKGRKWQLKHTQLNGVNVKAHPIDFIENGVDFNHAIKLHGLCHENTTLKEKNEVLSVHLKREDSRKGNLNIQAYGPFIIDYNIDFYWRWHVHHRFLILLQLMPDGSFTAHRVKMKSDSEKKSIAQRVFEKGVFIFNEIKVFKAFMKEDHLIMINRRYLKHPDLEEDDLYSEKVRKWYSQFYIAK